MSAPGYNADVVLNANVSGYQQQMGQANDSTNMLLNTLNKLGQATDHLFKTAGRSLSLIGAGDIAFVTGAVVSLARLDAQMAQVSATAAIAGGTNIPKLTHNLQELSTEIPKSTEELAQLSAAIMSLGVRGADNISRLTETFARLGAVTGESATQLAQQTLQLTRSFGNAMDPHQVEGYASSLASLSAKLGTASSDILSFAQAVQPLASMLGMTQTQTLGLAAAFTKAGANAGPAFNAFNTLVSRMIQDVQTGDPDLREFANLLGVSSRHFSEMVKTNPARTVAQMMDALQKQGPTGIRILQSMGIEGIRSLVALQRVVQGGGIQRALDISEAGRRDPSKFLKSSNEAFDTLGGNIERLKHALTDLASGPFEVLYNIVNKVFKVFADFGELLVKISHNPIVHTLLQIAGAIATVAGPFLVIIGIITRLIPLLSLLGIAWLTVFSKSGLSLVGGFKDALHGVALAESSAAAAAAGAGRTRMAIYGIGRSAGAPFYSAEREAARAAATGAEGSFVGRAAERGAGGLMFLGRTLYKEPTTALFRGVSAAATGGMEGVREEAFRRPPAFGSPEAWARFRAAPIPFIWGATGGRFFGGGGGGAGTAAGAAAGADVASKNFEAAATRAGKTMEAAAARMSAAGAAFMTTMRGETSAVEKDAAAATEDAKAKGTEAKETSRAGKSISDLAAAAGKATTTFAAAVKKAGESLIGHTKAVVDDTKATASDTKAKVDDAKAGEAAAASLTRVAETGTMAAGGLAGGSLAGAGGRLVGGAVKAEGEIVATGMKAGLLTAGRGLMSLVGGPAGLALLGGLFLVPEIFKDRRQNIQPLSETEQESMPGTTLGDLNAFNQAIGDATVSLQEFNRAIPKKPGPPIQYPSAFSPEEVAKARSQGFEPGLPASARTQQEKISELLQTQIVKIAQQGPISEAGQRQFRMQLESFLPVKQAYKVFTDFGKATDDYKKVPTDFSSYVKTLSGLATNWIGAVQKTVTTKEGPFGLIPVSGPAGAMSKDAQAAMTKVEGVIRKLVELAQIAPTAAGRQQASLALATVLKQFGEATGTFGIPQIPGMGQMTQEQIIAYAQQHPQAGRRVPSGLGAPGTTMPGPTIPQTGPQLTLGAGAKYLEAISKAMGLPDGYTDGVPNVQGLIEKLLADPNPRLKGIGNNLRVLLGYTATQTMSPEVAARLARANPGEFIPGRGNIDEEIRREMASARAQVGPQTQALRNVQFERLNLGMLGVTPQSELGRSLVAVLTGKTGANVAENAIAGLAGSFTSAGMSIAETTEKLNDWLRTVKLVDPNAKQAVAAALALAQAFADLNRSTMSPAQQIRDIASEAAKLDLGDPDQAKRYKSLVQQELQAVGQGMQMAQQYVMSRIQLNLQLERSDQDLLTAESRLALQFQTTQARELRDYRLNRTRETDAFNLQERYNLQDHLREMRYMQQDYQTQVDRSNREFIHQEQLYIKSVAQTLNPFAQVQAEPVGDATSVLANVRQQNEMYRRAGQQLTGLRRMGLSQNAIDLLGLSDPNNMQKLNRFFIDLSNNPSMITSWNRAMRDRFDWTKGLATNKSSTQWREMERQHRVAAEDAAEDFEKTNRRTQRAFDIMDQRATAAFHLMLQHQEHDFNTMITDQTTDYETQLNQMEQDHTTATNRALQDLNRFNQVAFASAEDILQQAYNTSRGHIHDFFGEIIREYNILITGTQQAQQRALAGGGAPGAPAVSGPLGGAGNPIRTAGTIGTNPQGQIGYYGPHGGFHAVVPQTEAQAEHYRQTHIAPPFVGYAASNYGNVANQMAISSALFGAGVSAAGVAGIIGNLGQESSFDPRAGQGTAHQGIGQWDATRFAALRRYARQRGMSPWDINAQIGFLIQEARSRGDLQALSRADTPAEAVAIFNRLFERSGEHPGDRGYTNRLNIAMAWWRAYRAATGSGVRGAGGGGGAFHSPVSRRLTKERTDQGIDFGGNGPVFAVGDGTITNLYNSGWPGGAFIVLKLDHPQGHGRNKVFYAEDITPTVRKGEKVLAGEKIGMAHGQIEIGWAAPNAESTGSTLARYRGHQAPGPDPGARPSIEGRDFVRWVRAHGGFERGGIAMSEMFRSFAERGPEAVLPLNQQGASFILDMLRQANAAAWDARMSQTYASPVGANVRNTHVDSSTNFTGEVTVLANDPNEMANALKNRARLSALTRPDLTTVGGGMP